MTDDIRLEEVRVRYPAARTPALDGVTLPVESGGRVGVAGRTGVGKSTLALLAAGFIPRVVRATVEGRATVGETDLVKAESKDLLGRVGIVFATPANQLSASNPLSDSLIAGTSGSTGERLLEATPIARSRPLFICGSEEGMLSKNNCTLPGIKSESPGALPLYGTCSAVKPPICFNISCSRCESVPWPCEANASSPGRALPIAMTSFTFFAGSDG